MLSNLKIAFDVPNPSLWFVDAMPEVRAAFAELYALEGREQPIKWHPEGNAWWHTMLTLDRAKDLGATHMELWGALVHDLGKAVTVSGPPKFQHINHEALGVPLVESLGRRLGVEDAWIKFGQLCAKYHLMIHRFDELRAIKRVDLLTKLRPYAMGVALVSQADAQGRGPTFIDKPYPQRHQVTMANILYMNTLNDLGYFEYHHSGNLKFIEQPISDKDRQIVAKAFIKEGFCRENEK